MVKKPAPLRAPVSRPHGKTSASRSPDHDPPEPDRLGNTRWCTCRQCVPMPTTLESICCREIQAAIRRQPSGCITEHPYFHTLCLDEVVLGVVLQMFEDHRLLVEETWQYRYIGYRQLANWLWGRLGRYHRKVLPACAVHRIRERFPSETFTGFEYAHN